MENREFVQAFRQRGINAFENNEPFEAYIYLWLAFLQSCAPDRMKADDLHFIINHFLSPIINSLSISVNQTGI